MSILWDDRSGASLPPEVYSLLADILRRGLALAGGPKTAEISVSLVTRDEIRQLNHQYRDNDTETDVLSFPFSDAETSTDTSSRTRTRTRARSSLRTHRRRRVKPEALGDIVICTAVAEEQAVLYGHSFTRELAFLAAHGLLHLLGYDHMDAQSERAMRALQTQILQEAGMSVEK